MAFQDTLPRSPKSTSPPITVTGESPVVDIGFGRYNDFSKRYAGRHGLVHVAGFTTPSRQGVTVGDDGSTRYAGVMTDASHGVSSQGNTLESQEVVRAPLDAYRWEDPAGFNALPDRLMRALEAGSVAGGDVRCNNETVRQTTAMAVILVARGGDAPYATENIGMTDAGTPDAPWLALSVHTERFAENPLLELRRQYDAWRRTVELEPLSFDP